MKFSHIADAHLGAWREPAIADLNEKAFVKAVDVSIENSADFVLISGDLFNTSIPPVETLKTSVTQLRRLKERGIQVYAIAGSHDYSPSGKTMLEVLEEAQLLKNVCRGSVEDGVLSLDFTTDRKTGAKITGMTGRKGMLDRRYYESLDTAKLEDEKGFKIFMFHTALTELKTEELERMESAPASILPRGFDYYAGGHVHIVRKEDLPGRRNIVYPGPVFPNSFAELEKLGAGSMYVYADGKAEKIQLKMAEVIALGQDCEGKTPEQANMEIRDKIPADMSGAIALLRLSGTLESGRTSDINLKEIAAEMEARGAVSVLKNTAKLMTRGFEEIKVKASTAEETEQLVIKEHASQATLAEAGDEQELIEKTMLALDSEKKDGEKSSDYEKRISEDARRIFNL